MVQHAPETRYIGMDIHKRYAVIGGVNRNQEVVLKPRRVDYTKWSAWIAKHLRPSDQVVIEATGNTWQMVDEVRPFVCRVVVAHGRKVKLIAAARVKTDKVDVLSLAHLLAANLVPEVWIPPADVREVRRLISSRHNIVRGRVRVQNTLHAILHQLNIVAPAGRGSLFRPAHRLFWENLEVSPTNKLQVLHGLSQLDLYDQQLEQIDDEIARLSRSNRWEDDFRLLLQMPGLGMITGMTILGAIGDISRFESAKKLVGYAGLGAAVYASGDKTRTGKITKSGRRDIRRSLIQAAHVAARSHPHWKSLYQRLSSRLPKAKAIVAIARKLLVAIWHILTNRVLDAHSSVERIGYRFASWYWQLPHSLKESFSRAHFVRWQLMQLGVGHTLTHIPLPHQNGPGQRLRLASAEDALAIFG